MVIDNIFTDLSKHADQIEQQWETVFKGICNASVEYSHLDIEHFNILNNKFNAALERLHSDLESPTLILATTGTTSSGKSTIVNLLCGADLMPCMAQEMSAGVVYIHHSSNERHLKVHDTEGALWECGEWYDLSDTEIRDKLTEVMDSFNKSKGINQPATPHIDLTYPIACFSNPELLALSGIPKSTKFKLMDLPGLRNQQDNTNADVIKNCRDALCVVAYNMEETDESRRLELVQQVLEQIKHMGGSPVRMLFALNRIDVFRKDNDWKRRQDEHVNKTKEEITGILHEELPEHRDTLGNLSYSLLSSLPALYAQRIKIGNNYVHAAEELDEHFNTLIPDEILHDLPRKVSAWKAHDFKRVSEAVWKSSYGTEFFENLNQHIQENFPMLVIPSIVQRFENEVSDAIGEAVRTCYSELNSSKKSYDKTCGLLSRQNTELRGFLGQSEETLFKTFNNLLTDLKKNPGDVTVFEFLAEDLLATDIYRGRLSTEKLNPLYGWLTNLSDATLGILEAMRQSIDYKRRNFSHTSAERLPERLQQQLEFACTDYNRAVNENKEECFETELHNFFYELNAVVNNVITMQSELENNRIRETIELLMKHYLNYLQEGIDEIAPQWNLSIGHHVLETLTKPELKPVHLKGNVENKSRTERIWWTLWLSTRTIDYKSLPSSETLHKAGRSELDSQIEALVEPFDEMIRNYLLDLNKKITEEQQIVLADFENKLKQAHTQQHNDYEKVMRYWKPLHEQSEKSACLLKKLVNNWEDI